MRTLALCITLLSVSGCVPFSSFPKTIDEFHTGKYVVREICAAQAPDEAYALLYDKLVQCYQGSFGSGQFHQSTEVERQTLDDGTRQLALLGSRFYQQLIEIGPSDQCPSLVEVYEITPGWEKHTARVKGWLDGVEAGGCGWW